MKTKLLLTTLIITAIFSVVTSCKKDEDSATLPVITTIELTNITDTSATSGGNITSTGGAAIIERGVCWGTTENPTITDNVTLDNSGLANFTCNIGGLKGGTNYYVRAYATNSVGTSYGQSVSLATIIKTQTVTLGASYANDVYYSLKNGVVATVPRANWDIAFSVSKMSSSIIINESAGVVLKKFPNVWSWESDIDTAGYSTWTSLRNSNTSWEDAAFNQEPTGGLNYGWGDYDMGTHNINGVTKYIIKLRDGSFKKIFIELKKSSLQKYTFRFANLDGTSPTIVTDLDASGSDANYIYYNLANNSIVTDREPDATTWDLLFTKWEDIVSAQPYMVTGVLQNIDVKAIDITTADPLNVTYTDDQFLFDINTIGYDWKTFNNGTFVYDIPTNRAFIVKNVAGKVYKIIFKSFAGSSTGILTFDIKEL